MDNISIEVEATDVASEVVGIEVLEESEIESIIEETEVEASEGSFLEEAVEMETLEKETWDAGMSTVVEGFEETTEEATEVSVVMMSESINSIFREHGFDLSDGLVEAIMDFMNTIFATVMVGGRFKIIKQKFDLG